MLIKMCISLNVAIFFLGSTKIVVYWPLPTLLCIWIACVPALVVYGEVEYSPEVLLSMHDKIQNIIHINFIISFDSKYNEATWMRCRLTARIWIVSTKIIICVLITAKFIYGGHWRLVEDIQTEQWKLTQSETHIHKLVRLIKKILRKVSVLYLGIWI